MNIKKWLGSKPDKCQLCRADLVDIFIDGRVARVNSWAIMCPKCYEIHGSGLGIGYGQKYQLKDSKWVKVEE